MYKRTVISILLLFCTTLVYADYAGDTLYIPLSKGGLNYSPNMDAIPNTAMNGETRNVNLHNGGRQKRGGTSISDATITSSQIMGIYKYRLTSGTENIMVADIDGTVYQDGTSIVTGMSVGNYFDFETYNDKLFIVDGASTPQIWDGSATATTDINSANSDWASNSDYPFQVLTHKRGNSPRVVMVTAQKVYLSSSSAGAEEDFSGTGDSLEIAIDTNDGIGIVGCAEYGNRLFCFGKNKSYYLDDSSSTVTNWGFYELPWVGGAANWRCLVPVENNLVVMTEDGVIYDISTVQQYGDYKKANLTRPAYLDKWIRDKVNLGQVSNFHGIYDDKLRAVKFFVQRKVKPYVDTALVYFVDRGPQEGWMIHGNWTNNSGYRAASSAVIRDSAGVYTTYTGDYIGNVWKLEQATASDNSQSYYSGFECVVTFDDLRRNKQIDNVWLASTEEGSFVLSTDIRIDNKAASSQSISLLDPNSTVLVIGDSTRGLIGTNTIGAGEYSQMNAQLQAEYSDYGRRAHIKFYTNSTSITYFAKVMMIDFKPLGRPD